MAQGANAVGSEVATPFTTTTTETFLLSGVDAVSSETKGALVTLGDSITDGISSGVDQNDRWPDQLAARLRSQRTSPVSKVNLATITPFHGSKAWSPQREAARNEFNAWIRSNTVGADYVVDFDATLRDPADHSRWLSLYPPSVRR